MQKSEYIFELQGHQVIVDRRNQQLSAEIDEHPHWTERPPLDEGGEELGDGAISTPPDSWQAPLHASVAEAGVTRHFTPAMALSQKAKRFDDRLMATVEQMAHDGLGRLMGKRTLLRRLSVAVGEAERARGLLDAAAELDGRPAEGRRRLAARRWLKGFLTDPMLSKPLGIYGEDEELSRIYRQDRLLQTPLEPDVSEPLRAAIEADDTLAEGYRWQLAIAHGLTGPEARPPVTDPPDSEGTNALFPPSESAEGRLIKSLLGGQPVPEGFDLGRELVERIRDGRLDTTPGPGGSWYAHQLHAMAALLDPDVEGLTVGPRYREELDERFQALFGLTRETHIKQLEPLAAGGRPLVLSPYVTVEPLPEYYLRLSQAYRAVRRTLLEALGHGALTRPPTSEHTMSLDDELWEMVMLLKGAALIAREELGRPWEDRRGDAEAARAVFRRWQLGSPRDPDLEQDLRTTVPLWFDLERRTYRVRVVAGLEARRLSISFDREPEIEILSFDAPDQPAPAPLLLPFTCLIATPITFECDLRTLPDRDELRQLCDQCTTAAEIREALADLSGGDRRR